MTGLEMEFLLVGVKSRAGDVIAIRFGAPGNRPNRAFGRQTPLQRMGAGVVTDVAAVRAYVHAAQAPWSWPVPTCRVDWPLAWRIISSSYLAKSGCPSG